MTRPSTWQKCKLPTAVSRMASSQNLMSWNAVSFRRLLMATGPATATALVAPAAALRRLDIFRDHHHGGEITYVSRGVSMSQGKSRGRWGLAGN